MDIWIELADETMEMIENYYPEFLTESGMEDNLMTKAGFYGAMKKAIEEIPLSETKAQEIVIDRLEKLANESLEQFKQDIIDYLFRS